MGPPADCGLELGPPAADGHAGAPGRPAEEFGRIDVRLRLDELAPLADRGGCWQ